MKITRPGQEEPYSGVVKQPQLLENNPSSNSSSTTNSQSQSIAPTKVKPVRRREIDVPAPSFRAERGSVSDNELVSTHVDELLSKDSPLLQRARTQGSQYANSRGLNNSSIAAEAATGAMVDRITPIAQQDADTYLKTRFKNQDDSNALIRQNASNAHGAREAELDRLLNLDLEDSKNQQQQDLQTRDFNENRVVRDFQAAQNEIERQFQGDQTSLEREIARDKLAQETATELFRQVAGQQASLVKAISTVQSADLEGENKQALVNTLIDLNANSLQTTSVLADFTVQNGRVVYNEPEKKEETVEPEQEIPYWQRPGFRGYGGFNF